MAEQQRGKISGGENERAESFAKFGTAFERMVVWQAEMGDTAEVFQVIERAHARSLLDEIGMAGADIQIGRSASEREQSRQREREIRNRIAELDKQAEVEKNVDAKTKLLVELAARARHVV